MRGCGEGEGEKGMVKGEGEGEDEGEDESGKFRMFFGLRGDGGMAVWSWAVWLFLR